MDREILRLLRTSREFLFMLIMGPMGTYTSALPDCPAETVLLTMQVILLPCMSMLVILLACYLVISGP
uniref:Uncharacterized protein n=1 Tax=Ixodes ricinus TaxID=34613 RepID=A0A6B0U1P3_IXORI